MENGIGEHVSLPLPLRAPPSKMVYSFRIDVALLWSAISTNIVYQTQEHKPLL